MRGYPQFERRSGMPVPNFCGVHRVPTGHFARLEQEVDRGRDSSVVLVSARIAKSFAVEPTFRVRLKFEVADYVFSGQHAHSAAVLAFADLCEYLPV